MALLEEFWHWRLALRFQKLMPVPASVFVTISLSLLISLCFSLFLYISVYTLSVCLCLYLCLCLSVCLSVCVYLFPLPPLYVSDVSSPTPLVPWCLYACLPAAMFPTLTILDHPFILLASHSWIFSLYVILVKVCPTNKTVNKKAKQTLNQWKDQLRDGRGTSLSVHMTESSFLDNRMVLKTKHQETCLLNIKTF